MKKIAKIALPVLVIVILIAIFFTPVGDILHEKKMLWSYDCDGLSHDQIIEMVPADYEFTVQQIKESVMREGFFLVREGYAPQMVQLETDLMRDADYERNVLVLSQPSYLIEGVYDQFGDLQVTTTQLSYNSQVNHATLNRIIVGEKK